MSLLDKLKIANRLKRSALAMHPRIGVTIIVHEQNPGAEGTTAAVATTQPSRAHMRALLAEVLAQAVLADGHNEESASAVVAADHAAYFGEPKG